jgi:hypothetical protein
MGLLHRESSLSRTGYVGVFDIAEPEVDRQGYRFRFLNTRDAGDRILGADARPNWQEQQRGTDALGPGRRDTVICCRTTANIVKHDWA